MTKKRVDKEQVALKVVIDPIVVVVESSDNQKLKNKWIISLNQQNNFFLEFGKMLKFQHL